MAEQQPLKLRVVGSIPTRLTNLRSRFSRRLSTVARSAKVDVTLAANEMTVPNADRAIIAPEKLTAQLLNVSHKRGAAKARLLLGVGYRSDAPHLLASDLRAQHLSLEMTRMHENPYGIVYEIEGPIKTPSGRSVPFCSVWQVDTGTDVPRFITMTRGRTWPSTCTAT